MKHTATKSWKFRKLVRCLRPMLSGLPVEVETVAVGLLERMWHVTALDTPQGDIGRLDNEMIAELIGWFGDADVLVEMLIECQWLDACEPHRLVVHDWQDHAPRYVVGNLKSHGKQFAIASCYKQAAIAGCHEQAAMSPLPPNLTKPNLTKPNQNMSPGGDTPTPEAFVETWNQAPGVVTIRKMSAGRHKKLRERLRDESWWSDFHEALKKFPLGFVQEGASGGWRPDIDFILRPDSVTKVIEGKYDGKRGRNQLDGFFDSLNSGEGQKT